MKNSDTFYAFDLPRPEHYPLPRFIHIGRMTSDSPWHYAKHEEPAYEWFIIEKGAVRAAIDGIHHDVQAGDLYVVQPHQIHIEQALQFPVVFTYLKFALHDFRGQSIDLFPRDGTVPPVARGVQGEFLPQFQRILREVQEPQIGCEQVVEATILQMIWLLRRRLALPVPEVAKSRSSHPHLVERIHGLIRERLREPLSLSDLARHAKMSPAHFGQVFRELTGRSPMQYLLQARMDYALILMNRNPQWSLAQVADHVGFRDPLYFSRQFKKVYGFPPSKAREQTVACRENLASIYPDLYRAEDEA